MGNHSEDLIFIDVNPENIPRKNAASRQLDDSGFVEDLEEADIGEDLLGGINGVIELDDESFSRLQSNLEKHLDTELENSEDLLDFRIKPCFVRLYRSPVCFEEDEDVEIKPNRGRGRPRKNKNIQNAKKSINKYEINPRRSRRVVQTSSLTERRSGEKKDKEIIEIDLVDDEDSETEESKEPEVVKRAGLRLKLAAPQSEIRDVNKPEELSEYEKIREENIRERREMFRSLGLTSDLKELRNSQPRRTEKRKTENWNVERRKSARLAARDDDEDYVPSRDQAEEPEDDSQVGVRRHPCKECANCLKPDCGRCIFCRDKKKFGGRNIKKQRCEFKERCSSPIIAGVPTPRLLSCDVCSEQFEETFQLDQHREKVHQVEQVRRRSSRLLRIKSEYEEEENIVLVRGM